MKNLSIERRLAYLSRRVLDRWDVPTGTDTDELKRWLTSAEVPAQAAGRYGCFSIERHSVESVGGFGMLSDKGVIEHGEENPGLLSRRLLPLGNTPSGDWIVSRYAPDCLSVGYVEYGDCEDDPEHAEPVDYIPLCRCLFEFLRLCVRDDFPSTCHEALRSGRFRALRVSRT